MNVCHKGNHFISFSLTFRATFARSAMWLIISTWQSTLQNRPFCNAKRPISTCEMAYFDILNRNN